MISLYGGVACSVELESLIVAARVGLSLGLKPTLSDEGTGGTYMLRNNQQRNILVFKVAQRTHVTHIHTLIKHSYAHTCA